MTTDESYRPDPAGLAGLVPPWSVVAALLTQILEEVRLANATLRGLADGRPEA